MAMAMAVAVAMAMAAAMAMVRRCKYGHPAPTFGLCLRSRRRRLG